MSMVDGRGRGLVRSPGSDIWLVEIPLRLRRQAGAMGKSVPTEEEGPGPAISGTELDRFMAPGGLETSWSH